MKHFFSLLTIIILLTHCKDNNKNNEQELKDFTRRNTLIIKGSDTELEMVKDLTKEFVVHNSDISIDISGGGSNFGIEALIKNEIDIANSSREMNAGEIKRAKQNGVNPVPIMFSIDALAIITNSKLGIDSLSTDQLTQVFSGQITNWKSLGGQDLPIVIFGRNSNSGTYTYLKNKFMKEPYSASIKQLNGNDDIVNAVQNNLGAIGYVGVGFLMDKNGKPNGNIWAMPIYLKGSPAYSPYQVEAVKKGDYILTRPLYQYINGKPNMKIYDFIMSELNLIGQNIIKTHGFFQINDFQKEINKLNGL